MKASNHHQVLGHTIFLVLLICQIPQEVIAYHSEYQNQHHEVDLRSSSHHGHHGIGVSLIRSKREVKLNLQCTFSSECEAAEEFSYCGVERKCICKDGYKIELHHYDVGNVCIQGADTHYSDGQFSCTENAECSGLERSYCDSIMSICTCPVDHPIPDYNNGYCVAEVKLNSQCTFNSECETAEEFSYCGVERKCICKYGYIIEQYPDVGNVCIRENHYSDGYISCTENAECSGLERSYCDSITSSCTCPDDHPIADYYSGYCIAGVELNSQCTFDSECNAGEAFSYCGVERKCICIDGYTIEQYPDVGNVCIQVFEI